MPLGCPVYVYLAIEVALPGPPPPFPPRLTALRGGVYVDVTDHAASTSSELTIPVENKFVDCDQVVVSQSTSQEPFTRHALVPTTVQVGERIGIGEDWFGGLEVLPPGPCEPADVPMLVCTESPPCGGIGPPFEDFGESSGCGASAGGGSLAPAGLLALLVARRRRRTFATVRA